MVINHNLSAIDAYRVLKFQHGTIGNYMETLTPGMLNSRAGNNASALTITEKIQAQIQEFFQVNFLRANSAGSPCFHAEPDTQKRERFFFRAMTACENLHALDSLNRGDDMAEAPVEQIMNQVLFHSGTAIFAQAN